jgi:hypothetical protein
MSKKKIKTTEPKKVSKPLLKSVCIVRYVAEDNYGKVSNSIEAVLSSDKVFPKWLKQHNKERKADGNSVEDADEFDYSTHTIEIFK